MRCSAISSKSLDTDQAALGRQWLHMEILAQLHKVSQRLEKVEDQVAASSQQAAQASAGSPSGPGKLCTDNVLVHSNKPSKKCKK